MRLGIRGGAVVVLVLALVAPAVSAGATCGDDGGVVPGTDASVTTVSAGDQAFYIVEGDYLDWDEDGEGGLWIYEESNGEPGLQRGRTQHWALGEVVLPLSVIPALVPWPLPWQEPSGWGLFIGRIWQPRPDATAAEYFGMTDACEASNTPDRLWF